MAADSGLKNPVIRFLALSVALYAAWHLLYEFVLRPFTALDEWVVTLLVRFSEIQLTWLGYPLQEFGDTGWKNQVGIAPSGGITVGEPCDGIVLFVLFVLFVALFPGKSRHRWWFIPLGIASIHLLNSLRITALALIFFYRPEWLAFNHDYTFTIIVYSYVFFLWMFWVKKCIDPQPVEPQIHS